MIIHDIYAAINNNTKPTKMSEYYKYHNGLILKRLKDNLDGYFVGIVVSVGGSDWSVGCISDYFCYEHFKPYTPTPQELIEWDETTTPTNDNPIKLQYALWLLEQRKEKNETIGNSERLSKEPVYNAKWLNGLLQRQYSLYSFCEENKRVFIAAIDENQKHHDNYYLDPKASANIAIRAIAKEFNGDWDGSGHYAAINYSTKKDKYFPTLHSSRFIDYAFIKFKDADTAKKAIDVLTTHFPEVIKNYFL